MWRSKDSRLLAPKMVYTFLRADILKLYWKVFPGAQTKLDTDQRKSALVWSPDSSNGSSNYARKRKRKEAREESGERA